MGVTNYIWDVENDSYLMETNEAGETTAEYTNEPAHFGRLVSQRRDDASRMYHFDAQHSTRQLTDVGEAVGDRDTYAAFGEQVARSGSTVNPFGYKGALGYYTNPSTDDLYVRARTYEPTIARWLAVDPLGFVDGSNAYSYVRNQVLLSSDPSGTRILTDTLAQDRKLTSCASYSVKTNWVLDKAIRRKGFILQRVYEIVNGKTCDDKPVQQSDGCIRRVSGKNSGKRCDDYFELWVVRANGIISHGNTDTFAFFGYNKPTKGKHTKGGSTVFLANSHLSAEEKATLANVKSGATGVPNACSLRSKCRGDDPNLDTLFRKYSAGFAPLNVTHKHVTKEWDCCCPCPPSDVALTVTYATHNIPFGNPNAGELASKQFHRKGQRNDCRDCDDPSS